MAQANSVSPIVPATATLSSDVFRLAFRGLFVGEDIALRLKKAKRNGTTSNISTGQQQLIDMQITIPKFFQLRCSMRCTNWTTCSETSTV